MPQTLKPSSVAPWLYWPLAPIRHVFLGLYFGRITIYGCEHLPEQGPLVLAPKHFSRWDALIVAKLSRKPFRFMANANQFTGLQGWLIERLGAFPVDTTHPQLSSLRHALELLHDGHKLVLFPEGGIVQDQILRPLKPGLARLVVQAEATAPGPLTIPIVPIALRYHPGAYRGADIFIHISPPLYTRQYQQGNERQTAQALTKALQIALISGLEETQRLAF